MEAKFGMIKSSYAIRARMVESVLFRDKDLCHSQYLPIKRNMSDDITAILEELDELLLERDKK